MPAAGESRNMSTSDCKGVCRDSRAAYKQAGAQRGNADHLKVLLWARSGHQTALEAPKEPGISDEGVSRGDASKDEESTWKMKV